jgi:uncharacterized damage-inducible protein DinB
MDWYATHSLRRTTMNRLPKWFERKFDFNFPVELYPNLMIRLRGTPPRLEELVRDCGAEILVRRIDDKWSAQEHAGHLLDLERLWLARVRDFAGNGTELTAADLSNRKTHEAKHNARPLQQIIAEFRAARGELLRCVEEAEQKSPAILGHSLLHPRLKGPMRLVDHLFFVAEHDDHHLAWIWELVTQ